MKHEGILKLTVVGLVVLTIILMVSGLTGAANPSALSVGYVSLEELQKNLPEFEEGKKYVEGLMQEYNLFAQYIQTEHKNALKTLEDEKNKAKQGKSAEEQRNIDAKYEDMQRKKTEEIQKKVDQKKTEIGEKINENNQATINKVKKIIEQVAKADGISLVMEEKVVYFGGVNLTQKVLDTAKKTRGNK